MVLHVRVIIRTGILYLAWLGRLLNDHRRLLRRLLNDHRCLLRWLLNYVTSVSLGALIVLLNEMGKASAHASCHGFPGNTRCCRCAGVAA